MNYNPQLINWRSVQPVNEAGKGHIEHPEDTNNVVWQTRSAPPNDYEIQLCDTLETLFQSGVDELHEIIAGLNEAGIRAPAGGLWNEENFQAEMKRLGA